MNDADFSVLRQAFAKLEAAWEELAGALCDGLIPYLHVSLPVDDAIREMKQLIEDAEEQER